MRTDIRWRDKDCGLCYVTTVLQPVKDEPRQYAIVFHDSMEVIGTHYEPVLSAWFTKGPDESERNDPGAYITATLLQPD